MSFARVRPTRFIYKCFCIKYEECYMSIIHHYATYIEPHQHWTSIGLIFKVDVLHEVVSLSLDMNDLTTSLIILPVYCRHAIYANELVAFSTNQFFSSNFVGIEFFHILKTPLFMESYGAFSDLNAFEHVLNSRLKTIILQQDKTMGMENASAVCNGIFRYKGIFRA